MLFHLYNSYAVIKQYNFKIVQKYCDVYIICDETLLNYKYDKYNEDLTSHKITHICCVNCRFQNHFELGNFNFSYDQGYIKIIWSIL